MPTCSCLPRRGAGRRARPVPTSSPSASAEEPSHDANGRAAAGQCWDFARLRSSANRCRSTLAGNSAGEPEVNSTTSAGPYAKPIRSLVRTSFSPWASRGMEMRQPKLPSLPAAGIDSTATDTGRTVAPAGGLATNSLSSAPAMHPGARLPRTLFSSFLAAALLGSTVTVDEALSVLLLDSLSNIGEDASNTVFAGFGARTHRSNACSCCFSAAVACSAACDALNPCRSPGRRFTAWANACACCLVRLALAVFAVLTVSVADTSATVAACELPPQATSSMQAPRRER